MKPILPAGIRRVLRWGLLVPSIVIWGCLSESDFGAPFYGLWKERDALEYTVRDSLFRAALHDYADGLGYRFN